MVCFAYCCCALVCCLLFIVHLHYCVLHVAKPMVCYVYCCCAIACCLLFIVHLHYGVFTCCSAHGMICLLLVCPCLLSLIYSSFTLWCLYMLLSPWYDMFIAGVPLSVVSCLSLICNKVFLYIAQSMVCYICLLLVCPCLLSLIYSSFTLLCFTCCSAHGMLCLLLLCHCLLSLVYSSFTLRCFYMLLSPWYDMFIAGVPLSVVSYLQFIYIMVSLHVAQPMV